MSSAVRALAQVAPLKRYVAQGTADSDLIARLYDAEGNASVTGIPAGTTFIDMGKSVVLANGAILRKVKQELAGDNGYNAYMYVTKAPAIQYMAALL